MPRANSTTPCEPVPAHRVVDLAPSGQREHGPRERGAPGTTKAPTVEGEGRSLPELDSNQQPAGIKSAAEHPLFAARRRAVEGTPEIGGDAEIIRVAFPQAVTA